MRIVAIVASYNEQHFIGPCIEHFARQGVETYLLDNESTDRTVEIARSYLGKGLITIETLPRNGTFELEKQLKRKEEIADEIKADWYIHADADEIRLPPREGMTLAGAISDADREGFNAINFINFLFLPTVENPEHEHSDYQRTILTYRYLEPSYPNQIKGWKRQKEFTPADRLRRLVGLRRQGPASVNLHASGGHKISFEGLKLSPVDFKMKHYQILSLRHAVEKYAKKVFSPEELARGWHGWRGVAKAEKLRLPYEREMRKFIRDDLLDTSEPLRQTLIHVTE